MISSSGNFVRTDKFQKHFTVSKNLMKFETFIFISLLQFSAFCNSNFTMLMSYSLPYTGSQVLLALIFEIFPFRKLK